MNYELCKALKDAGFPLKKKREVFGIGEENIFVFGKLTSTEDLDDAYLFPTLSELIEECGEDFKGILRNAIPGVIGKKWVASDMEEKNFGTGDTYEEAVAHLYIELHKK